MNDSNEMSDEKKYAPLRDFGNKITGNNLQQNILQFHNTLNEAQPSFRDLRDYKYTLQSLRTSLSLIADVLSTLIQVPEVVEDFENNPAKLLLALKIVICMFCNDNDELKYYIDDNDDDDDSDTLFGGDIAKLLILSVGLGFYREILATETVLSFTDNFFENFIKCNINEKFNLEIKAPELKNELNSLDHNVINTYDDFSDEFYDDDGYEYDDTDDIDFDSYVEEIYSAIEQFDSKIRFAISQLNIIIKALRNINTSD